MQHSTVDASLSEQVRQFVRAGFTPHFGQVREASGSHPAWRRLRDLGTELWLDTGDLKAAAARWTNQFSALTTNNTLLNKEVQKGIYDGLIAEAKGLLAPHGLSDGRQMLEIAFILNARHGLRLVEAFDAYVSVEEHTALADDVEAAVAYARRYHAICPERFIVKIPLTPAGLLATRRLSAEGVPVNHTLGFSARQNYVAARLGRPAYVNVFLARLNSFVAENGLGDGQYVGERATVASQRAVRGLRGRGGVGTRQIGASLRAGPQVRDLAGIDVMTIPPDVAAEFLQMQIDPAALADRTDKDYRPALADGVDPKAVGLPTLWEIDEKVIECVDAAEAAGLDGFAPEELVSFFAERGCGDLLVDFSDEQIAASAAEGKIPKLGNWKDALVGGRIGLDALMNLAGLNAFAADQKAMDDRVRAVLAGS